MPFRSRSTPHARTMLHPGRFNPVRINCLSSSAGRHVRLSLMPGATLFDGLVKPLAEIGIANASTTILGGYFSSLEYCVAIPDPKKSAVIAYSDPIQSGQTYMVFGNATLGESLHGQPLLHCHATIRTQEGLIKGGHILTERTIVAKTPISVLVTSIDDFAIRQAFDPETNIPLLQPTQDKHNV